MHSTALAPRRPLLLLLLCGLLVARSLEAEEAFVDVASRAGVDIVHVNGARGQKHLPETINGGGGWIDHDGDGRLDLYLVQGHEDASRSAAEGTVGNRLLRNRGDGTFEDVTERAGVGDRGFGSGMAVGDIDNDGDSDLFVTNFGRNTLYLNVGDGRFRDITVEAGVGGSYWSSSACFADIDGDGLLDLYVANYLIYDPRVHKACTGNPKRIPGYCHPNKYDGAPDELFLNRGDGRFEDISRQAGVDVRGRILAKGLGVLPTDFDEDGDIDFFVANDSVPNFLWRNLGGGRFEDAALEAGVALSTNGQAEACMGIDGGDVDGDGLQDYYITNFAEETDTLFRGEGDGFFDDATFRAGLGKITYVPLGFGVRLFDHDLDGDLDLYVARGHIMDNLEQIHPGTHLRHAQPDQLIENDGKGVFRDISSSSGAWFQRELVGRAAAFADYDDDGDIDIFVVNCGGQSALLESRSADRGDRHWIGLRLVGTGRVNRDAFGSVATLRFASGARRSIEIRAAASYATSNDARAHIGLGESAASVPAVEVRWTDGSREEFTDLAADRYHTLVRGAGRQLTGR